MQEQRKKLSRMTRRAVFYTVFVVLVFSLIRILIPRGYSRPKIPLARVTRIEMHNLASALNDYHATIGAYPLGDNGTILQALMGTNSKQTVFFAANYRWIDTNGFYVDPWQTPYEIRVISTNTVSIRSAGKNKRFGDTDDMTN